MKVPVLTEASVRSVGLPESGPLLRQPDETASIIGSAVAKGVGNVTGRIDRALTEQDKQAAKAKQEAQALSEADKLLEQHERAQRRLQGAHGSKAAIDDAFDGIDSTKGGFLATKGMNASKAAADVVDALERDQQDIAATISDPLARQRFLVRSREQLLVYRKAVEGHTSKELEAAKVATRNGRKAQAFGMAKAGVLDIDSWLTLSYEVEEDIKANALSPEVGEAERLAFRAENGLYFVQGLTDQGRIEEAKALLEDNKLDFANGGTYDKAFAAIEKAEKGAKRDQLYLEMRKYVDDRIATVKVEPGGYLTEKQIRDSVPNDGYDADSAKLVEERIRERVAEEIRRRKADTDEASSHVDLADHERRQPDGRYLEVLKRTPEGREWLRARDSRKRAEWYQAESRQRARDKALTKAERQRAGEELKAQMRRQKQLDRQFQDRIMAAYYRGEDVDLGERLVDFIVEQDEPAAVSAGAQEHIAMLLAKEEKSDQRTDGRTAFTEFEQAATNYYKKKGKPVNQAAIDHALSVAMEERRKLLDAKGEKAPKVLTAEELSSLRFKMFSKIDQVEKGLLWDTTKSVPFVETQPTPQPKAPTTSPKPKQRRPFTEKEQQALQWVKTVDSDPNASPEDLRKAAAILKKLNL